MRNQFTLSSMYPQISFVRFDSADPTTNINTFTLPATYRAGDFVYLFTYATNNNSTFPPDTAIPGWTRIQYLTNTLTNFWAVITTYFKVLTAQDPGSTVTIAAGNQARGWATYCYRAQRPFRKASVFEVSGQFTNGDPAAQATTLLTTRNKPVIAIGGATVDAATVSVTTNLTSGDRRTDVASGFYADTIFNYNVPLTNVNIDMTDAGNFNCLQLQYFVLE